MHRRQVWIHNQCNQCRILEQKYGACSVFVSFVSSSSAKIFLLGLEFIFVDLAAGISLTQDLYRRILLLLFAFANEPTNSHDETDDKQDPEKKHHRHHSPTPPPHRMHFPVPLVHTLLCLQRTRASHNT